MPRDPETSLLLQQLLDDEGPELRRAAFLLTGSWEAADEALTAAVVRVASKAMLDDGPRALREARRELLRWLREHSPTPIGQDPAAAPGADRAPDAPSVGSPDPVATLLEALQCLPFDERGAVVLRHLHLDDARVADALEVDPSIVPALLDSAVTGLEQRISVDGFRVEPPGASPEPSPGRRVEPASSTIEEVRL